jgi:hypothetical protein
VLVFFLCLRRGIVVAGVFENRCFRACTVSALFVLCVFLFHLLVELFFAELGGNLPLRGGEGGREATTCPFADKRKESRERERERERESHAHEEEDSVSLLFSPSRSPPCPTHPMLSLSQ